MAETVNAEEETSPLIITEAPRHNRGNCFTVIKEEFRLKNFGFNYENPGVFYKSQWQWPRIVFVLFRLSLAIYTGTFCILTLVYFPRSSPNRPWPVWLTNWSYFLLTCHEICAATIAVVHWNDGSKGFCSRDNVNDDDDVKDDVIGRRRAEDVKPLPCYMKLDWLIFSVAGPVAMNTTFSRFAFSKGSYFVEAKDLHNHILTGFVALLDYCIGAIPVRLFHLVYVIIYYTIYQLFSYIFWSFDHTDNVLYPTMDWDYPESVAIGWATMALVVGGIMQIFVCTLYRLRLFVYSRVYKRKELTYEPTHGY